MFITTCTDNPLLKKIESVFAIQSILSGFLEVIDENNGMSLHDLVKMLTKIKSLFAISAILLVTDFSLSLLHPFYTRIIASVCKSFYQNQDQSAKSECKQTVKYKGQATSFSEEVDFCCQQVAEDFAADKQLWPTVNHARSLISSFSCVDHFKFHESSKFYVFVFILGDCIH